MSTRERTSVILESVNGLGCVNQTEEFGQLLFNVSVTGVTVNNGKKGSEGSWRRPM
jgi:hypothetical protein